MSRPTDAIKPKRAGVSEVPGETTSWPARTSLPGSRTFWPGATGTSTRTRPPWTGEVHSTITTESAPGGMGAPVMIRTAWPGPTGRAGSGAAPAARTATTSSSTGASVVSSARTA